MPLSRRTPFQCVSSNDRRRRPGGDPAVAAHADRGRRSRCCGDRCAAAWGDLYDTGFNLRSRRQFCSRFVREVLQESTGEAIGEVQTFRELLERNPAADLRIWKMWYFGRIPWDRTTVTPESLYTCRSLQIVFDGTVALHRRGPR